MTNTFIPTKNPYVKDEKEAASLNADVMALFRIGSLLLVAEHLQVPTIEISLRQLARDSREGVRALVWEVCNVIREHAENGVDFPPSVHPDCPCPNDHTPHIQEVDHFNAFLANAKAGEYDASVEHIDSLVGVDVFEVLLPWVGIPCDHIGRMRYGDE